MARVMIGIPTATQGNLSRCHGTTRSMSIWLSPSSRNWLGLNDTAQSDASEEAARAADNKVSVRGRAQKKLVEAEGAMFRTKPMGAHHGFLYEYPYCGITIAV